MAELRDLENETAEALLNAIKSEAERTNVTSKLLELAQAFAAVVDAAPGPEAQARVSRASRIR
jgi:hypothetical protein